MSINKKVFFLFTVIFIIVFLIYFIILKEREKNSINFENKLIENKLKNLHDILNDRISSLNKISYEYSKNEMVIDFLNKEKLVFSEYTHITSDLNITYFIIFDNKFNIVFSEAFDINNEEYLDTPDNIEEFFKTKDIEKYVLNKEKSKFITLNYEKIIFSIDKVDNLGYIFVGRTLDSTFLTKVSLILDSYLSLIPSYTLKENIQINKHFKYDVQRLNEDHLYSHIELNDELDDSKFFFLLKIDRFFHKEIKKSNYILFSLFFISIILLSLMIYIFIKKIFVKRIKDISATVKKISDNKRLDEQISLIYDDEITYLSKKMNEMFYVINNTQNDKIKKERDFLQSVLDSQQHIIFITDGNKIESANKRFLDIFKSSNGFLDNIALLDNETKVNLIKIAKNHSSIEKPAKFIINEQHNKYFTFDVSKVELKKYIICMNDVSTVNEQLIDLKNKASIDDLTTCFNKVTIINYINHWLESKTFALLVLDIDKFKFINDTYGHLIGDYILRDLAKLVKIHLQEGDLIGRYGGEEFIILLDTKYDNIINVSNRLRKKIEENTFSYDGIDINITASFGCTFCKINDNYLDVFKKADEALYEAKNSGRNKVILK
ncbi:MAG: GGDEF domain-containing protein [Arcobacter sp.]|nr:GGDEF domain-containing protein [Arcobacter sp.]